MSRGRTYSIYYDNHIILRDFRHICNLGSLYFSPQYKNTFSCNLFSRLLSSRVSKKKKKKKISRKKAPDASRQLWVAETAYANMIPFMLQVALLLLVAWQHTFAQIAIIGLFLVILAHTAFCLFWIANVWLNVQIGRPILEMWGVRSDLLLVSVAATLIKNCTDQTCKHCLFA